MLQLRAFPGLFVCAVGLRGPTGKSDLESDVTIQQKVLRPPDLPEAPSAEAPDQTEFAVAVAAALGIIADLGSAEGAFPVHEGLGDGRLRCGRIGVPCGAVAGKSLRGVALCSAHRSGARWMVRAHGRSPIN